MDDNGYIGATVPLYEAGDVKVGELEVRVYPFHDPAWTGGIADTVQFLGSDEKWHDFASQERDWEILRLIETHDPSTYADIICERDARGLAYREELQAEFMAGACEECMA